MLGDEAIGGFEVEQLIDLPAEDLRREIETFFSEGRPQDLLLFYVSGHGVLSQSRRFYFATANTSLGLLRSTAIEDGFVNDVMQSSRARSIVLVLDCCHSGAFGKGLAPKSATTVDVEHRFEGRGRVTLSASTELEYAFEETDPSGINELGPAAPGSLFTRSLVEGLQSGDADIDEDGRITVDDLYDYVCRRVRERSVHQTPGMAGDVRGQIVIARSPRRAVLSPELGRAVASNMAGIRAGAVSELGALLKAEGPESTAARAALERLAEDDSHAVATAAAVALGRPAPPERAPPKPPPPAAGRRRPDRRVVIAAVAVVAIVGVALAVAAAGRRWRGLLRWERGQGVRLPGQRHTAGVGRTDERKRQARGDWSRHHRRHAADTGLGGCRRHAGSGRQPAVRDGSRQRRLRRRRPRRPRRRGREREPRRRPRTGPGAASSRARPSWSRGRCRRASSATRSSRAT